MKKYFLITFTILCFILLCFPSCRPSVSPEDQLLIDYEKYIDDIIAEYKKIDAGDFEAYNNIASLSEIGTELKIQIRIKNMDFNEIQRQKFAKLEEKRRDYFDNRQHP